MWKRKSNVRKGGERKKYFFFNIEQRVGGYGGFKFSFENLRSLNVNLDGNSSTTDLGGSSKY